MIKTKEEENDKSRKLLKAVPDENILQNFENN